MAKAGVPGRRSRSATSSSGSSITDYAQELLDDLTRPPGWPEQVVVHAAQLIGRSLGVQDGVWASNTDETLRSTPRVPTR